jgi:hypothetical protein
MVAKCLRVSDDHHGLHTITYCPYALPGTTPQNLDATSFIAAVQHTCVQYAKLPPPPPLLLLSCSEVGYTWLHDPCREMLSYGLISEGIPERMHPKSFRSTFETHTHVWATRQPRYTPYVKVGVCMCCCEGCWVDSAPTVV